MRFIRVVFGVCLVALVVVPAALALRFTDESYSPPVGQTGKPYPNWSFTGAGGCGPALPYQYRLLGSSAPPGLTIDSNGLVHGIPTQEGDYSFWLELSDENPPSASWCRPETAQRQFTIKIVRGLNITYKAGSLPAAGLNQAYTFELATDNPGAALVWSVQSGALPSGLGLDGTSGKISGTPTALGDYTFKIQVKDASGLRTDVQTYTLSVVQPLLLTVPQGVAEVGLRFQLKPQASGGKPAYEWSLGGGTSLPAGLALDPSSGAITGTPTAAGSSKPQLVVKDSIGLTNSATVSLVVVPHLLITRKPLPVAKVGAAYTALLRSTGGARPRSWTILGGRPGSLPKGLKLNAQTGRLSGTPTQAGTFRLRIQVSDALGAHSAAGIVLKVAR
jgi:hypothetical protein